MHLDPAQPQGPDSPRPRSAFMSAETLSMLRGSLQLRLTNGDGDETLRLAIRRLCDEARQRRYQPEQLIVAFKETWRSLPEVQQLPRGEPREELLGRAVTLCIDEYFRAD